MTLDADISQSDSSIKNVNEIFIYIYIYIYKHVRIMLHNESDLGQNYGLFVQNRVGKSKRSIVG